MKGVDRKPSALASAALADGIWMRISVEHVPSDDIHGFADLLMELQ